MDSDSAPASWHVVVGATGGTGSSLVRQLAAAGRPVRAVSRRGAHADLPGVQPVAADATDPAAMRAVCAGAAAVYHCVNPPLPSWREVFPRATTTLLEAAGRAGARLVFADDTWMYGRADGDLTESTPYRPVTWHGVLRAWLAEAVLAAHARGDVRVAVARAGELYGPRVTSLLGANVFGAAAGGRRVWWPGDLDRPLTPCFVDDFAHALLVLGDRPEAVGAVWHVPTPPPVTGRKFVGLVRAAAGRPGPVSTVSAGALRLLRPVFPVARDAADMIYQFEQPFVVDATRFVTAFGDIATGYPEAISATLAWYRSR